MTINWLYLYFIFRFRKTVKSREIWWLLFLDKSMPGTSRRCCKHMSWLSRRVIKDLFKSVNMELKECCPLIISDWKDRKFWEEKTSSGFEDIPREQCSLGENLGMISWVNLQLNLRILFQRGFKDKLIWPNMSGLPEMAFLSEIFWSSIKKIVLMLI